jgi:hypothetical protein
MNCSQSDEVVRGEDLKDCPDKNCPDNLSDCHSEPPPTALAEAEVSTSTAVAFCVGEAVADIVRADSQDLAEEDSTQADSSKADSLQESRAAETPDEIEDSAWRDELTARLSRYRARRKMRPPRYPSLTLPFDAHRSLALPGLELPRIDHPRLELPRSESPRLESGEAMRQVEPVFEVASNRALALDLSTPGPDVEMESALPVTSAESAPRGGHSPAAPTQARSGAKIVGAKIIGAKIIEFPRHDWEKYGWEPSFEPSVAPPDQLAEPVSDRPRILEVPDFEPRQPALGGITIEPVQRQDAEKRLGIDIPVQTASLARRIFASLIDGLIVGVGVALFGYIFWRVTGVQPPLPQVLAMAAGSVFIFWAAYQYLLLVYAATTPGLLATGLELARFNGSPTSRSMRRWRVLASYLSAVSLGMGYAWVFLDEDVLCWHDRITHTYLAPTRAPRPKHADSL